MHDFEYLRPKSLPEAVTAFNRYGKDARLLAGGTELVNEMRFGKTQPKQVIDLKHIEGLDYLDLSSAGLRIGALYRVRDAERSVLLRRSRYGAISFAAGTLGSPQVRNKATIVGNLCRCSPSADLIPPLLALDARAKITGNGTERVVEVEKMLLGPGKTVLETGEIVTELEIPGMSEHAGCSYYKLSPRNSLDLAIVGVAVMVRMDPYTSRCVDARIVLGAVAPTAIRVPKAEAVFVGSRMSESTIEEAARIASDESKPLDDVRASAWYRKKMVGVIVKRTTGIAMGQINKKRR